MILDNIDWSKEYEYTLILTKKNKKPIGILSSAYDRNLERSLDGLDKLTFAIPYNVQETLTNNIIKNPYYDNVMEENLILLKCGDILNPVFQSYFIIKNITESSDKMSKQVECSSRQVSLNKSTITLNGIERQLKKDEVDIADGIFDLLGQETSWSAGYIDENARVEHINGGTNNKYRWFDALSKPWLQFLNEDVATAFNVILMYDTVNKKVNVYDRDSYGRHTGIILSEENYVKNISKKKGSESVVTKLNVSGRNGLTFEDYNPYGTTYITNYDYFRNNGQMSDELIEALDKYDILVNAKNIEFQNFRSQINNLNSQKIAKQSEMTTLNEELKALRHIQSGYMASGDNTNLTTATNNVNNKVIQIANKQAEINSVQSQIDSLNTQLGNIANAINKKNAKDSQGVLIFNNDLLEELEDFTYEESWSKDYYSTPESLYKASQDVLKDWSIPPVEFNLDLVDLFACMETQRYWDKINLGDLARVYSSKLNINVDVRIVGYSYNIDNNSLKITFSNKNKKLDDARGISSVTKKSYEASKVVNVKRLEWNSIKDVQNAVDMYLNNAWDLARQNVIAKVGKNKIDISENGIFCINADDENQQIAILSSVIAITKDGWETCSTAIDSTGVYAETLVGKMLIGSSLYIGDESGIITIQDGLITIQDQSEIPKTRVKLGKYATNKYGLQLFNKSGQDVLISEDGILVPIPYTKEDNVDVDDGLEMLIYIDSSVLSIQKVRLAFKLLEFRSYEKSIVGGSSSSTTTASGGSTVTLGSETPYASTGDSQGVISGGVIQYSGLMTDNGAHVQEHYHNVDLDHVHNLPTHSHGMSHTHATTITRGIYKSTKATEVRVYLDDVLILSNGGSGYSTDQMDIDLTSQFQNISVGFHTLKLTSTQLGRIHASLFINQFYSM